MRVYMVSQPMHYWVRVCTAEHAKGYTEQWLLQQHNSDDRIQLRDLTYHSQACYHCDPV